MSLPRPGSSGFSRESTMSVTQIFEIIYSGWDLYECQYSTGYVIGTRRTSIVHELYTCGVQDYVTLTFYV